MNSAIVIDKLTTFAASSTLALRKLSDPLWRMLTFSLADDSVYPAKAVCAAIEKAACR